MTRRRTPMHTGCERPPSASPLSSLITSFYNGRARLRHPALRDRDRAENACALLDTAPGMTCVTANPRTGSLLQYDPAVLDAASLLQAAEQTAAEGDTLRVESGKKTPVQCAVPRGLVNRGMLAALAGTLGFALAQRSKAHALAGGVFVALNAFHLYIYRRCLLK